MLVQNFRGITSIILLTLLTGVGCGPGSTGAARYDISGMVSHQGQPVPQGRISFDTPGSNEGGGFANIEDGKFDTKLGGRGHLGGDVVVQINGVSDELVVAGNPDSGNKPLFPTYETTVKLPQEATTQDFQVP